MDFGDAFDVLADDDFWMSISMAFWESSRPPWL